MAHMFRAHLLATSAAALLALSAGAAQALDAYDHTADAQVAATTVPAGGATAESLVSPKFGTWGFDLSGMDRSVKPGDDFYKFASGKWAERTEIPADRSRYGSGDTLQALSEARIHAILEEAAAGKLDHPDAAKIAAAYGAFMDLLGSPLGKLVMFAISLALFYHLANGVRHLIWDAGHGLDLKSANSSAYAVFGFTIAATLAIWVIAFMAGVV